jgi:[protein-PII] uridylyltransferase
VKVLPEWDGVRARPQRNPYHRYTVDRHLLEAAAGAARLAGRVDRPDLLVVAALLHDIGKGQEGDHSDVGADLASSIARRMGFAPSDVETIATLVRHHLLLAEVATTRDLDDPATIDRVAMTVGSEACLQLLAALTEADAQATGPAAWSAWKAELVSRLVDRTAHVLGGGHFGTVVDAFPGPEQLALLARGERHLEARGERITVVWEDRPGIFSRIAGVLALHGLDVLAAAAHSTDDGWALSEFRVAPPVTGRDVPWARVVADLERALDGRLALGARLADRARTYRRNRPASTGPPPSVTFDNDASSTATVIDVTATDGIGLLYRVTRALADLDLDIRSARVETRGTHVLDAFYVRGADGGKITAADSLAEVARAIVHSVDG